MDQKQTMGANAERSQGFSGYGVERVRDLEGPLTDLMVPDRAPKGITDPVKQLGKKNPTITNKQKISMLDGTESHKSPKILNNRLGVIRDKPPLGSKPFLDKKITVQNQEKQATTPLTQQIEARVERLEHINDAHVITDGTFVVIGIETNESNRNKIIQSIEREIGDIVDLSTVHITVSREMINRMKAIEHGVSLPGPFKSTGGTAGELIDLMDDAWHKRR